MSCKLVAVVKKVDRLRICIILNWYFVFLFNFYLLKIYKDIANHLTSCHGNDRNNDDGLSRHVLDEVIVILLLAKLKFTSEESSR